jgi:hypothetical protein
VAQQPAAVGDAVGVDGEILAVAQRIGNGLHCAAAAQHHRRAVGNKTSGELADHALGVGMGLLARIENGLAALQRQRAAVRAVDRLPIGQQQNVAADGFTRDLELALNLGDRRGAALIDQIEYQALPLFRQHVRCPSLTTCPLRCRRRRPRDAATDA